MIQKFWTAARRSRTATSPTNNDLVSGATHARHVEEAPFGTRQLSLEQLERHARSLAAFHQLANRSRPDVLLPRLAENRRVLQETHDQIRRAVAEGKAVSPATEWLLDNFYLIENQIGLARQFLPPKFINELPQLAHGPSEGKPRIYDLSMELISDVDGRIDAENIARFISAYQSVNGLRLGELWAMPLVLRLALIENLRRVAVRIAQEQKDRELAEFWADRMLETADRDSQAMILRLADLIRVNPPLSAAFVATFTKRLRSRLAQRGSLLEWLEGRLDENGQTIEQLVDADSSNQVVDRMSMGNSITSLRSLGTLDWKLFVEEQSRIEQVLRESSPEYIRLGFSTRDAYRQVVEHIARYSPRSEEQVARVAVELTHDARNRRQHPTVPIEANRSRLLMEEAEEHVGYYLVDDGRKLLEQSVGYRTPSYLLPYRFVKRNPLSCYLGSIAAITVLALALILGTAAAVISSVKLWFLLLVGLCLILPASQFALSLVNWIITLYLPPRSIRRLDLTSGIPEECRTMVVVPTMLSSKQAVFSLLADLETRFLANQDPNLRFALLTDFPDAPTETLPTDEPLLDLMTRKIEELNQRYAHERRQVFYLCHRPRLHNPSEGTWMARERKRGKLEDFNELVLKGNREPYSRLVGDLPWLAGVRYVITLDTDTDLPPGSAKALIGCMCHPLNRPRLDTKRGLVVRGYTILQPRIAISVTDARKTRFTRLFAGEGGIDPYTKQVSDVYQDLFGEGSFTGKGIYEVQTFQAVLHHRFPDNRILSHDLLESAYVRSGFVNDVEVIEGFPTRLLADMSRRHRWIRGDWQIMRWLFQRVPGPEGLLVNPTSLLSRWKIFDNLRRSLVAPAVLLYLVLGWLLLPSLAWLWTASVLVLFFGPALPGWLLSASSFPGAMMLAAHLRNQWSSLGRQWAQASLNLALVPYETHCNIDAILTTLYRLTWNRRKLLQWTTASEAERRSRTDLIGHFELMAAGPVIGFGMFAGLAIYSPLASVSALPIVILWIFSPGLAWWVSQPTRQAKRALGESQQLFLRRVARRTWRFYQVFAAESDHWLAPDNWQEHPSARLATRTSPTNIGMGMLADLTAYDFGYQSIAGLGQRLRQTTDTILQMEQFHGHLYNWYDTRSLQAIEPRYISTVDSGNMAGHLLVLRSGLRELEDEKLLPTQMVAGFLDSFDVTLEVIDGLEQQRGLVENIRNQIVRLKTLWWPLRQTDGEAIPRLHLLLGQTQDTLATTCQMLPAEPDPQLAWWLHDLQRHTDDFKSLLDASFPWLNQPPAIADWKTQLAGEPLHKLEQVEKLFQEWYQGPNIRVILTGLRQARTLLLQLLEPLVPETADGATTTGIAEELAAGIRHLQSQVDDGLRYLQNLIDGIQELARQLEEFALGMDFRFLYDTQQDLFSIGYNVTEHRLDGSRYDLLASEARLASFVAIATKQVPVKHWFSLGRQMTTVRGEPTLLSWSGSMFEYLMPELVMPTQESTLLYESCRVAVRRQIDYAQQRGVPWGISESCYNVTDAHSNYQYRAFGVPGLGMKRGLSEDLVIAPYASMMAVQFEPLASARNLETLAKQGFAGEYGFYESIDYTASRRGPSNQPMPCRTFMAHHNGMALVALGNTLLNGPMFRRFLADPQFRAHQLLLEERIPEVIRPVYPNAAEVEIAPVTPRGISEPSTRSFDTPHTTTPEIHLLSNGRYHVVVSNAGGGYSQWQGYALTRWEADPTRDAFGLFCYVRDVKSGKLWSNTYQPTCREPVKYSGLFSQGRVEIRRVDEDLDLDTLIAVSPEEDVEVRRLTIANLSRLPRTIEVTTYGEVVLASPDQYRAHRIFANLFVETELLPTKRAILCSRRPRKEGEQPPFMFHMLICQAKEKGKDLIREGESCVSGDISFETDRFQFLGRQRDLSRPAACDQAGPLHNSAGAVLEPIVAIRRQLEIAPEETVRLEIITGIAETREQALAMIDKYQDHRLAGRVFEISWTHSQLMLERIGASEADAQLYSRLASALVYRTPQYRTASSIIAKNRRAQDGLWGYAISGDLPIVLVRLSESNGLALLKRMLQAHSYWRMKGLTADLVVLTEDISGYRNQLQEDILQLIGSVSETKWIDRPGGLFIRRADQMPPEDKLLLQAVAALEINDSTGRLVEQIERRTRRDTTLGEEVLPTVKERTDQERDQLLLRRDLLFFNGWGGFTQDGREYVQILRPGRPTPAPWSNILANPTFGSVVSEAGSSYTWAENAHEYRLTPWSNDPVADPTGEAFYIKDEETGKFFSPLPQPARGTGSYLCRHGFGYSVWEYSELSLRTETWTFVPLDSPCKIWLFKIRNESAQQRTVSLTGYVEWILGVHRERTMPHIVTELEPRTRALVARNRYHIDLNKRLGFIYLADHRHHTADRQEFIGRLGSLRNPAALRRDKFSGRVGGGMDPCGALQTTIQLGPNEERELVFMLGSNETLAGARSIVEKYGTPSDAQRALEQIWRYWERVLTTVYAETPDQNTNFLFNGWLLYQTLACRSWGRSGFYQSGGAYGFRDQLQDSLALLLANPEWVREHLLRCAGRQFREGDVQHWWHPPTNRGVRTRISDDYLWLPYVTTRYVETTGDTGVLDEVVPYLADRQLTEGEEDYFGQPQQADEPASLYEHCKQAIRNGLRFGPHNLPLMGSGDWNDGMNRVGIHGTGESVWLAFFLYLNLRKFADLAGERNDEEFARECHQHADELKVSIESAWDGAWYRRAYFDSGEPLGSAQNEECQIDALPQAWSVLSGAGDSDRQVQAMQSLYDRLVDHDLRIIRLFTPPFDKGQLNPGYIKGYLPGVRENGGQYTHAAIWTAMAFAALGDEQRAWECCRLLNPITHASTPESARIYKVEPYVLAADIYSVAPHEGRGGWTWYTGSAGWYYQLFLEHLFGLRLQHGNRLTFKPCPPESWNRYRLNYRFGDTFYRIQFTIVGRPLHHVAQVELDGTILPDKAVPLRDDRIEHIVQVTLGVA